MGDADDSYDFLKINEFYKKLKQGFDLVQGCRFSKGGGRIMKGAMPFTHKYIGNPFFSLILKIFFSSPFNDVYCGMRGFRRDIALRHKYICNGMQFAIENLIKFLVEGSKVCEIPIILHRDGRKKNKSHLKTISDGLKTLKLILIFSPNWLFFIPSIFLFLYFFNILTNFTGSFEILDQKQKIDITNKLVLIFMINLQILFLWLYGKLVTINLGFSKESKNLINFFAIFKLKYVFTFYALFLFLSLMKPEYFFNNVLFYNLLVLVILFNCVIISITELQKKNSFD